MRKDSYFLTAKTPRAPRKDKETRRTINHRDTENTEKRYIGSGCKVSDDGNLSALTPDPFSGIGF
jgi:hypothetical protein